MRCRYHPTSVLRAGLAVLVLSAAPARSSAQDPDSIGISPLVFEHRDEVREGGGFLVIADRRVFVTMAFLNAVGYDEEADGVEMHPLRVRVRDAVARRLGTHGEKLAEWRAFYDALELPVFTIVDYALALSTDYPFRRVRPIDELQYPTTEPKLRGLPDLLNDFWHTAEIEQVWNEVKTVLLEELQRYDFDKMERQLADLWAYLRMERSDPFLLVNVPNLLERHYTGQGAQYDNYYFQVESAGAQSYGLNVHEYLHSIVNPLVQRYFDGHAAKFRAYYEIGREGPYARSYQSPQAMTRESLVRALDYRLRLRASSDPEAASRVEARIAEITDQGLAMTQPFYRLLETYESAVESFDAFVPTLFDVFPHAPAADRPPPD